MSITFIGGGNMASALIGGLLRKDLGGEAIRVIEPYAEQRDKLAARFPGVELFDAPAAPSLRDAALVVMAVKPQQMRDAALALAPHLAAAPLVLSIAAGIRLADLCRWLGGYRRMVRAMPNTPALIGKGISGAYAAPAVDADGRAHAATVLEAGGELLWVEDEAMLDAVTAVSGSGPAYVFYFLEALMQAAAELGFEPDHAHRLAYATFSGALALAQAGATEPATLRAQVTSKGGTTERAITTMEADAVKAKIVAAVKAAAARAREMGDAFGASV